MTDHPKHIRGSQETYSHHKTSLHQNNDGGGPSNSRDKSGAGNAVPSSPVHGDEAQMNSDLLAGWSQRLQVLTVVTTFLTSVDGQLFSLSALNTQIALPTGTTSRELVYSCLAGALIFHVCACILGFLASFALIRYRIIDAAEGDEMKVGDIPSSAEQPAQRASRKVVLEPVRPLRWFVTFLQPPEGFRFLCISRSSRSPPPPPLSLLTNCYYTTLCFTTIGTILALIGILAYVWVGLPAPVGIFSTICLGIGVGVGMWALAT